jgi:hypothetical protein
MEGKKIKMLDNRQLKDEDIPPIILVTMRYSDSVTSFEDTFIYHNNLLKTKADINALFVAVMAKGNLIAPMFGLPQLAPIDFKEEMDVLNNKLPYSEMVQMEPALYLADGVRIDDVTELLMFSDIYHNLKCNKPSPEYTDRRRAFCLERLLNTIDEGEVLIETLSSIGGFNPSTTKNIKQQLKKINVKATESLARANKKAHKKLN